MVGLTKVAAIELANSGVTVNAICPGWVLTPLVEKQIARPQANATAPTSEQVTHDVAVGEAADGAIHHAGANRRRSRCSCARMRRSTITGVPLSIDGGWVAQ